MGLLGKLFGRREASTHSKVAHSLFMKALQADLDKALAAQKDMSNFARVDPVNQATYWSELYMLHLFAVDWSVFQILGPGDAHSTILDLFWLEHELMRQSDPTYTFKTRELTKRIKTYAVAVQESNSLLGVGKAFSQCMGSSDAFLTQAGTFAIREVFLSVGETLRSAGLTEKVFTRSEGTRTS